MNKVYYKLSHLIWMFCCNFSNLFSTGKAYAIFVANLPMNATVEQLERVFQKFGPIKRDGIQVRSNKVSLLQAFLQFCLYIMYFNNFKY